MRFDKIIQLLNHINGIAFVGKLFDQFNRQRINAAKLQVGNTVAQRFFRVLIGDAGGNHANGGIIVFHCINRSCFRPSRFRLKPLLYHHMAALSHGGHHHIFLRIFHIIFDAIVHTLCRFRQAARMGNARGKPQDHRRVKLLGELIGQFCIGQAFRRIRRLKHHCFGSLRVVAGILLIL